MKMRHTLAIASCIGTAFLLSSTLSLASTCPTDLMQDHQGYWVSHSKPGWKSHKPTEHGVTVSTKHFAGVVYSPERNRLACVYRTSEGKYVALVSNVHQGIKIDKNATDDSEKNPAWRYSEKHKDYACGLPDVKHISGCEFNLE